MTALPTLITFWSFLPVILLAAGLLSFMAIVLGGMGSDNRRTYFRRQIPAILIMGGIIVASGFTVRERHIQLANFKNGNTARDQMRAIRFAAIEYQIDFGKWPAGENREVTAKLLAAGETERDLMERAKLKFAPDGTALDPWGRPYLFGVDLHSEFEIRSSGPDGIMGSEDDLP